MSIKYRFKGLGLIFGMILLNILYFVCNLVIFLLCFLGMLFNNKLYWELKYYVEPEWVPGDKVEK